MNSMHIRNTAFPALRVSRPTSAEPQKSGGFHDLLQKSLTLQDGLKFSAHAMERLKARSISMSSEDMLRLNNAVGKAEEKGSRDSLVLMNDVAFVVSIKNKTVVTAMMSSQMRENVVTNIDSTVMA